MKVHYLQHVPFEGLGYIETWLKENDFRISATRFYEPAHYFPEVEEIDALIIMGGPMGVYDEHKYPWLHEEKVFIEDCIRAGKKVLGICLGAQLLAVCLGANVYTATYKELGWFRVAPTEMSKKVSWFYRLFQDHPMVFHWHGDKFEIPYDGSFSLLSSEANNNQAFFHSENVIGLQFHLEITEDGVRDMLQHCRKDLAPSSDFVQPEQTILEHLDHIKKLNGTMAEILQTWLCRG